MRWSWAGWQRTVSTLILGVLVTLVLSNCQDEGGGGGGTTTGDSTGTTTGTPPATTAPVRLVLDKDDSAAWITMNNSYDNLYKSEHVGWSGVLFQLGSFQGPGYEFSKVELYKGGSPVTFAADEFFWINIVADAAKNPIDPANAFYLFPNAPSDSCPTVDRCSRNRTIHGNLSAVTGLITYWHGARGYEIAAAPSPQAGYWQDRYEFSFLDPVRVEVRRWDRSAAQPTWVDLQTFAAGEVDSILVLDSGKPPDFGAKIEPGWPIP